MLPLHSRSREALEKLVEGNQRFLSGMLEHPHQDAQRVAELATQQAPFAAVFACSDSRVNETVVFDRGLGDIFTIRTAGHVCDEAALASVEFAVFELDVPLLVVKGHEGCGAIKAALSVRAGTPAPGHSISTLTRRIGEYLDAADAPDAPDAAGSAHTTATASAASPLAGLSGTALASAATRVNVRGTIATLLATSPGLAKAQADGTVMIIGAVYDTASGRVEFLDPPHPDGALLHGEAPEG